jgi:hypothetical protein
MPELIDVGVLKEPSTGGPYIRDAGSWISPTKAHVGLSDADNTSDVNKPVSTAQATAISTALELVYVSGISSPTLTVAQCKKTIIDNINQSADTVVSLPAAEAGLDFRVAIGATAAFYFKLRANTTDKIYLDGTAGTDNGYVGCTTAVIGDTLRCFTFKTGASTWDWMIIVDKGTWTAS